MRTARRLVASLSRVSSILLLYIYLLDASLLLLLARLAAHTAASRLRPFAHLVVTSSAFLFALSSHVPSNAPHNDHSIIMDFVGRGDSGPPTRTRLALIDLLVWCIELTRLAAMLAFHKLYYSADDVVGLIEVDVDLGETRTTGTVARQQQQPQPPRTENVGVLYPPPQPPSISEPTSLPPPPERRFRTIFPSSSSSSDEQELIDPTDDEMVALLPILDIDVRRLLWRVVVGGVDKERWRVGGNSRGVPV